jgi:hypothetical protein
VCVLHHLESFLSKVHESLVSKALYTVTSYSKYTKPLISQKKPEKKKVMYTTYMHKVLYTVTLYKKHTRNTDFQDYLSGLLSCFIALGVAVLPERRRIVEGRERGEGRRKGRERRS